MSWSIVADSSVNMYHLDDLPAGVSFTTVPLKIRCGEREFVDNAALNTKEMMELLDNYNGPSGSACPSPEEWAEKFLAADNSIAVTISSQLSGSYNSACIAAKMVMEEHPEKRIHVVDSLSVGAEMTFIVERAIELIHQGASFDLIAYELDHLKDHVGLQFVLCSFENLVKNGRMSRISGLVAGVLGIRAVGRASTEGKIDMFGKARGETKALALVLEEMDRSGFKGGKVYIDHVHNPQAAHMLARAITAKWPSAQIQVRMCGGLCSFYAQDQGLILGYMLA